MVSIKYISALLVLPLLIVMMTFPYPGNHAVVLKALVATDVIAGFIFGRIHMKNSTLGIALASTYLVAIVTASVFLPDRKTDASL